MSDMLVMPKHHQTPTATDTPAIHRHMKHMLITSGQQHVWK